MHVHHNSLGQIQRRLSMIIYRDKDTGRYASKSTWKRSKAHGGTRYVRTSREAELARRQKREREAFSKKLAQAGEKLFGPKFQVSKILFEWLVTWKYETTGKAVDFIATAYNKGDALQFVEAFMQRTDSGRTMLASRESWRVTVAKGRPSNHEEGYVETRHSGKVRKRFAK